MRRSKAEIIKFIKEIIQGGIKSVLMASDTPLDECSRIHGVPRIGIVMSGQVPYSFFEDNEYRSKQCYPGDAYYCVRSGYLDVDKIGKSRAFSVCYRGEYIRAVYAQHDENGKEIDSVYYHTNSPLSETGQKMLHVLDGIVTSRMYSASVPKLLEALLLITMEDIIQSNPGSLHPSGQLWVEMEHYMRIHYSERLTQKSLARKFNISPGYVSHLIKRFSGMDFTSLLCFYRLKQAERFLCHSHKSVDEISEQCGFSYTSYFITRFKKRYGVTPHVFRNQVTTKT